MHWFLWLLFTLNVLSALTKAHYQGKPVKETTYDYSSSIVLEICLAVGILVYGKII